jgi:hypothetical protein
MMAWDARKYRLNALECVEMARKVQTPQERTAFINLSARWTRLAEAVEVEQALLAQDGDTSPSDTSRPATILH